MRERDIERHLVRRVKEIGGEVRKVQWVGRRGAPDRLVMMPSRKLVTELEGGRKVFRERWPEAVWVELKAPGVKVEAHQQREHVKLWQMGQRVVVIDSLEGVEELLK